MILKASQRAHGAELAKHLLNGEENDHVTGAKAAAGYGRRRYDGGAVCQTLPV